MDLGKVINVHFSGIVSDTLHAGCLQLSVFTFLADIFDNFKHCTCILTLAWRKYLSKSEMGARDAERENFIVLKAEPRKRGAKGTERPVDGKSYVLPLT